MKLRSTTPVSSLSFAMRVGIVVSVIVMSVSLPMQFFVTTPVSADQYDDQIRSLKNKISGYEEEANALQDKANTLQNTLRKLAAEKSKLQAQIDLKQAEYDKLVKEIKDTENRIEENRKVSGELIVQSSMSSDVPLIVRLASSNNLADYIDGEASRISVRDTIVKKTEENEELKIQLKEKQSEVKVVLDEQKASRNVLATKEAEQANILAQTKSDEAAYNKMVSKANSQIKSLQQQQRDAISRITGGGKNTAGRVGAFQWRNYSGEIACGGGYPGSITKNGSTYGCSYGLDATVDEFSLYNRECVSYTAWAAKYRFNKSVSRFSGLGHAYQWTTTGIVESMGANVNDTPAVGAVAIKPQDGTFVYGHAMIVESILGDGWIKVSQYNFDMNGTYSTMEIPAGSVNYVHFR